MSGQVIRLLNPMRATPIRNRGVGFGIRPPRAEGGIGLWLAAVEGVLDAMAGKGLRAALLSEVIRRPVMESSTPEADDAVPRSAHD